MLQGGIDFASLRNKPLEVKPELAYVALEWIHAAASPIDRWMPKRSCLTGDCPPERRQVGACDGASAPRTTCSSAYDTHIGRNLEDEMNMRTKTALIACVLLWVLPASGLAIGFEFTAGTEPSICASTSWILTPSLSLLTSIGYVFGSATQTGSTTVQTASFNIGAQMRYHVPVGDFPVRPYLGAGASLALGGGRATLLLEPSLGMHIRLSSIGYVVAEASALVPIHSISSWRPRIEFGFGFTFSRE